MDVIGAALAAQLRLELLAAPGGGAHRSISMPSRATSTPRRTSSARIRGGLVENGIGVVDVDENLARGRRQPIQPLQHAARAALRQMSDIAGAFARNPQPDHLVIGPKGAVHQHAGGGLHGVHRLVVDGAEARRIEHCSSALLVLDHQREVVAGDRRIAVRRIRSGLAGDRQCAPPHSRQRVHLESGAVQARCAAARTPQKNPSTPSTGLPRVRSSRVLSVHQMGQAAPIRAACRVRWCDRLGRRPARSRRWRCRVPPGPAANQDSTAVAPVHPVMH